MYLRIMAPCFIGSGMNNTLTHYEDDRGLKIFLKSEAMMPKFVVKLKIIHHNS